MSVTTKTKTVYFFDASALITLYQTDLKVLKIPKFVWDNLEELFKQGAIVSHKIAYDEMVKNPKNPDWLSSWVGPKKEFFLKETAAQATSVAKIMQKFPKLIEPRQEKEQADPWIIALAVEHNGSADLFETIEAVVVTQESVASPQKIPAVCKHFKIRHLSLKEFFEERGIEFGITGEDKK